MLRLALAVVLLVGTTAPALADPRAVVRLGSHGASGVVIASGQGVSYILTAAHAFEGQQRAKKIELDAPDGQGAVRTGGIRLVKLDYGRDLALVEMRQGPLRHVCPVAQQAGRTTSCYSVGYDKMVLPSGGPGVYPATILDQGRARTHTRERPVPGRSGGALICDGRVVGICHGYEIGGRGIYVSLTAIHEFLGGYQQRGPGVAAPGYGPRGAPYSAGGGYAPYSYEGGRWQGMAPAPFRGPPAPPRYSESFSRPYSPPGGT
jgi:hypothetical protein